MGNNYGLSKRVRCFIILTDDFFCSKLYRSLGLEGEVDVETEGLLIQYDVDTREFSSAVLDCLPHASPEQPWRIPDVCSVRACAHIMFRLSSNTVVIIAMKRYSQSIRLRHVISTTRCTFEN
jgi:hypothetical protein